MIDFNFNQFYSDVEQQLLEVFGPAEKVSAEKLGLDPRAGYCYVLEDGIVVDSGSIRTFNYYGGFEYVDEDAITRIGDYTFFDRWADERVEGALECYEEQHEAA